MTIYLVGENVDRRNIALRIGQKIKIKPGDYACIDRENYIVYVPRKGIPEETTFECTNNDEIKVYTTGIIHFYGKIDESFEEQVKSGSFKAYVGDKITLGIYDDGSYPRYVFAKQPNSKLKIISF